jgi:PAS domain-containing protein
VATTPEQEQKIDGVRYLDEEEGRAYFDRQAHRLLGISGDEFLRRFDDGQYATPDLDDRTLRGVMKLSMLMDFVR